MEYILLLGAFIRWAFCKFDGNLYDWWLGKNENYKGNLIIGLIIWLIILVMFFVLFAILR